MNPLQRTRRGCPQKDPETSTTSHSQTAVLFIWYNRMSETNLINATTERRLRFAVLLNEQQLTRWDLECVSVLAKSEVARLELLVIAGRPWWSHLVSKCNKILRHILWFAFAATAGRPLSQERTGRYPIPVATIRVSKTATHGNCLGLSSPDVERP